MKKLTTCFSLVITAISIYYSFDVISGTIFFGSLFSSKILFVYIPIVLVTLVLSLYGLRGIYRSDETNYSRYVLGGVILPFILLIGLFTYGKFDYERTTTEKRVNEEKFTQEHCFKVDRQGYYYYKCDNDTMTVPEEFTQQFLLDKSR